MGPDALAFRAEQRSIAATVPRTSVQRIPVPGPRRSNGKAGWERPWARPRLPPSMGKHPEEREGTFGGAAYRDPMVCRGGPAGGQPHAPSDLARGAARLDPAVEVRQA
jgi:hypothetical protein